MATGLLCTAFALLANAGCSKTLPEDGRSRPLRQTVTSTGEYRRVDIDTVERMSIEDDKLVLHGPRQRWPWTFPPAPTPVRRTGAGRS